MFMMALSAHWIGLPSGIQAHQARCKHVFPLAQAVGNALPAVVRLLQGMSELQGIWCVVGADSIHKPHSQVSVGHATPWTISLPARLVLSPPWLRTISVDCGGHASQPMRASRVCVRSQQQEELPQRSIHCSGNA